MKAPIPNDPKPPGTARRSRAVAALARFVAVVAVLTAHAAASPVSAEQTLTWGIYTAAPYSMQSGPQAGQGIFDRIRHLFETKLGTIPQTSVEAPFGRIVAMIKDGAPWCFVGGVKTQEREAFAAFSLPIAVFYPLGIVVHATKRDGFKALEPISLAGLLHDRSLRTSLLQNRTMGPEIDPLLRQDPPPLTHSDFDAAMRMLLADRLDYLIEYANIASYTAERLGDPEGIVFLPVTESPQPLFSRVMCPRTEWGLKVIAAVDQVLKEERPSAAYRSIVEAWSDPDTARAIDRIYNTRFLTAP